MIPKDAREIYLNDQGEPIAYCPKDSIGLTDIRRAEFYLLNKERLLQLAARAKEKGNGFGVICIDVDDSTFREVVAFLMPGHDWEQYRARGESPVARGVVPDDLLRALVTDFYPAARDEFSSESINILICAAGGCSVLHP